MGFFLSTAPKMQTSPDSWQLEGASRENCCSASSPHDTARTEAQRLGILAFLATKKFKHSSGMSFRWRARLAPPLRKCECLQISGSQKGLAWKAVAQSHQPMLLLAQRHRDGTCLLVLPPQSSSVS